MGPSRLHNETAFRETSHSNYDIPKLPSMYSFTKALPFLPDVSLIVYHRRIYYLLRP